jgi:hypothetical protein
MFVLYADRFRLLKVDRGQKSPAATVSPPNIATLRLVHRSQYRRGQRPLRQARPKKLRHRPRLNGIDNRDS